MKKEYSNFAALKRSEKEGRDFRIRFCRKSATVVIAPHGGKIEPRTSEIARAIASSDLSFYLFEGIKQSGNGCLHVKSHRFDEPQCLALVEASTKAIGVHGKKGKEQAVYLGGRDNHALKALRFQLEKAGFRVRTDGGPSIEGRHQNNICNRCQSGKGIQLELTEGLRSSFFVRENGSRRRSSRFSKFIAAVRKVITNVEGVE